MSLFGLSLRLPCPEEVTPVTGGLEGEELLALGSFGDDSAERTRCFKAIGYQDSVPKECSKTAKSFCLYGIATVRTLKFVYSLSISYHLIVILFVNATCYRYVAESTGGPETGRLGQVRRWHAGQSFASKR